jgi:hypothetical protein
MPVAVFLVVTGLLQGRLGRQLPGRMAIVTGAGVLVLLLGGLASGFGVGTATLLMGIVVAALVVCDELRRGPDVAATT